MPRAKKNADGTETLLEDQGADIETQDEQGNTDSKNTGDTTKTGGDGENQGKAKPFTGKIKNPAIVNRPVFGVTGVPINFDAEGVAECSAEEAKHFLSVPGYEVV